MEEIAKKRKFSLEDDFMNLTVDDIIFGYIQHLATYEISEVDLRRL